jgi:hypothetical protein
MPGPMQHAGVALVASALAIAGVPLEVQASTLITMAEGHERTAAEICRVACGSGVAAGEAFALDLRAEAGSMRATAARIRAELRRHEERARAEAEAAEAPAEEAEPC